MPTVTAGPRGDPPLRARLLGPAAPPEGRRDRARAAPRPRSPGPHVRGRGEVRAAHRLPERRHRRVPAGPGRQLRLHRDEPAHPGRAHGDRGGHRRRPRAVADADRVRRDARGPRPEPGHDRAARCGTPVPDHHRGPGQQLPAGHRSHHDLPLPRRCRDPARRRYDVHGRGDQPPLRLDAGQADLSRPHLREGGRAGAPRARGVPDPRRVHEHRVPPGPARRPGLPGGPGHHVVHRDAPGPADRAVVGRPRHQAPLLPRRRHREPAARPGARQRRPRQQAAGARPRDPRAGRHAAAAPHPRAAGVRAGAARPGPRRGHRHHVPRRAPVAARHPRAHPRPARGRRSRGPDDTAAVVAGGVGRGDVRRGAALPLRGPVGAAGQAPPGRSEPLPADAAARAQHRRVHAVPHRRHRCLRRGGRGDRHRRVPDLRRAQRRRADAARDRGGALDRDDGRGGGALLHRRPLRPAGEALHARLLPRASRRGSSTRAHTCWRSRTWPACCARRPRGRW